MDMAAGKQRGCSADRAEFIGRHGSLAEPAALLGSRPLSNRVGGGLDPCGAMQTKISLSPGEEMELTFLLGEEASSAAAVALIERYRTLDLDAALKSVTDFWEQTLGATQVKTPDRSMDILVNGWLLYQTLVCRVWARTAFYQSSGAYGFRDQLQDVMALMVSRPEIAREHILRAAARQFEEGDVQHWWLPTSGQGVKTRVSDDRIWLAFVLSHYLEVTEDFAILDESVPYLGGGPLAADSHESFSAPESKTAGPLFEHCVRALDSSLTIGAHGLPLFGTGDWNDGMNRVGAGGPRRERLAGLVSVRHLAQASRPLPSGAVRRTWPRSGASTRTRCSRRSSAKPGTATGIGAATSMTARPWARSPAMNAESIPLPSRGR
jgi:cyclic beta-1,2-glucan synthetase